MVTVADLCHDGAVPDPAFPSEPEEVEASWLQAVLAPSWPGLELDSAQAEPVGVGLMGRSYRLHLETKGAGPASVVAKFPSADRSTRELGATAYIREIGFYRDLAAQLGPIVPVCHHAAISPTGEAFVLVLEDIHPAQAGDQITGCSPAVAHRALGALATLHASTWGADDIGRLPWMSDRSASAADLIRLAIDAFAERFAGLVSPEALGVFDAFGSRAEVWLDIDSSVGAAVHGDFRLDNLLFRPSGDAVVVDWQTVSFANPGRDLAYFLGNSLTIDDRRASAGDLVASYVDALHGAGVEGYDVAQAETDVRVGCFQGPLVTSLGAFTASRTERGEAMFAAMAERCATQIADLDALDVLDA